MLRRPQRIVGIERHTRTRHAASATRGRGRATVWLCTHLIVLAATALPVPAAAQEVRLQAAEQRVSLPTGVSLKYVEAGPPTAPVVILLHGFADSHQVFEQILPTLAQQFRVYALDQRGHGDSDKPECCYTQGDYVADVRAFMRSRDIPRAAIFGHSMGALVALKVAVDHPELVERLVLVGGAPACDVCKTLEPEITKLRDPIDRQYVHDLQKGSMYAPVPDDYFQRVVDQSMKVPANVWHRAWKGLGDVNYVNRLSQIRAPTLIVAGDRDEFFTPEIQRQLARPIPNSTLLIYEQTGHWPYAEQRERFLKDFLAWMEKR